MAPLSAVILVITLVAAGVGAFRISGALYAAVRVNPERARTRCRHGVEFLVTRVRKERHVARVVEAAYARKRSYQLRQAMPEALRLLSVALDSGTTLVKSLEYAANNCSEPLASELKKTVWDLQAGQGFDEAMRKLRGRTGGSEFAYLAVAMEIQHQSGGSLGAVLKSVSESLRQSAELEETLRTKTTQGRLSARVVALMPLALAAVISVLSPGYFAAFFATPVGIALLVVAVLLELTGIVLVRRALAVDLNAAPGGGSA